MKKRLLQHTLNLLDTLVPQGYLELQQQDIILRARATIVVLVVSALAAIFGATFAPIQQLFPPSAIEVTRTLMFISAFFYLLTIALFRYTGSFFWSANLYAVTAFSTMHLELDFYGGLLSNPLAQLLMLVPLMSFVIGGRQIGLIWTAVIIAYTFFYPASEPDVILNDETRNSLQMVSIVILTSAIFFALILFDLFNTQLRIAISQERNQFEFQAGHDNLTGLLNRASFGQRLENCIEKALINNTSSVIGLIDLDGFKPINDNIGHHAGDVVLEVISSRLEKLVRKSDTVARLGGDEFAFILEGLENQEVIDRIANKMLMTIAEEIDVEGQIVNVTGSIGLARFPQDASEHDEIVRAADTAMYKAKEEKGRYYYFHDIKSNAA